MNWARAWDGVERRSGSDRRVAYARTRWVMGRGWCYQRSLAQGRVAGNQRSGLDRRGHDG